jgi:glycosyl transferase family 2
LQLTAPYPRSMGNSFIPYTNAVLGSVLPIYVNARWSTKRAPRRHPLPRRLVVSLTSYPQRFPTLHWTLKCLLSQSVAPDEVILWIAREHKVRLPDEILTLQDDGLTIKFCKDLGPYTKIVPALAQYPDAYVVTADDDIYYGPAWLEELVAHARAGGEVLCHRAHRIRVGSNGIPLRYQEWEYETRYKKPCLLIFPTGVGGVLYPPRALHRDVMNIRLFRELCPSNDDVWLYWMMRKNGMVARRIGSRRLLPTWRGTQRAALWRVNVVGGANDKSVKAMTERFGYPQNLHYVADSGRRAR